MPEQKDMAGALFRNDRKNKESDPDYKGQAKVAGVEYWIAAWINEPRGGGQKYMALKYTAKDEQQQPQPQQGGGADQDDVPFHHDKPWEV